MNELAPLIGMMYGANNTGYLGCAWCADTENKMAYKIDTSKGAPTIYAGGLNIGLRGLVNLTKSNLTDLEQLRIIHGLMRDMHNDFDLRCGKELLEHVRTAVALKALLD